MRSYIAISLFTLSASVLSAPTPQLGLNGVLNQITAAGASSSTTNSQNIENNNNNNGQNNNNGNIINSYNDNKSETNTGNTAGDGNDVDVTDLTNILSGAKRALPIVDGLPGLVGNDLLGKVTKAKVAGKRQLTLGHVGHVTTSVDDITNGAGSNSNDMIDGFNLNSIPGFTKNADGTTTVGNPGVVAKRALPLANGLSAVSALAAPVEGLASGATDASKGLKLSQRQVPGVANGLGGILVPVTGVLSPPAGGANTISNNGNNNGKNNDNNNKTDSDKNNNNKVLTDNPILSNNRIISI